jgi:hypothetical protein
MQGKCRAGLFFEREPQLVIDMETPVFRTMRTEPALVLCSPVTISGTTAAIYKIAEGSFMKHVATHSYRPNIQKSSQLVLAGLVASVAMMAVAYLLRSMGIPAPDYASQYGAILLGGDHPQAFTTMWWVGLVWHSLNGILLFSFLFDFLADRTVLPSEPIVKGIIYGVGLWLLTSALVAPLAGEGFFFRNLLNPGLTTATNLLSWLVYGALLDSMTRVRAVHHMGLSEKKAA